MCWNLEVSLVAGIYGFAVSYYLAHRGYSDRDPWYGLFLATFTTTQLFDATFWAMSDDTGALPCTDWNSGVSRYVLPFAIFFQPWVLTFYPSTTFLWARWPVRLLSILGALFLAYVWGCTTLYSTTGWLKVPTLLYGGVEPPFYLMVLGCLFWGVAATMFCEPFWVSRNILLIGAINLVLLTFIDGTIRLLSKLCFYCLLLSILWLSEPYIYPPQEDATMAKKRASSPHSKAVGGATFNAVVV